MIHIFELLSAKLCVHESLNKCTGTPIQIIQTRLCIDYHNLYGAISDLVLRIIN